MAVQHHQPPQQQMQTPTKQIQQVQQPAQHQQQLQQPQNQQQQQQQQLLLQSPVQQQQQNADIKQEPHDQSGLLNKSGDMMITLNRLNTQESEVDVEGLSSEVKLEFETVTEEVAG